jgi:hypothetical protein
MKAVSYLKGSWSADASGLRVRLQSISDERLNARVALEPLDQWVCVSSINNIYRSTTFQIYQYGGVGLSTPQRELIYS